MKIYTMTCGNSLGHKGSKVIQQGQGSGQNGHRLHHLYRPMFLFVFLDVPMKRTRPTLSAQVGAVVC